MAVQVSAALAAQAKQILTDAAKDVFARGRVAIADSVNTGGFIAGPTPTNPILAYQQRVGRAACDRWARGDRNEIVPGNDLLLRSVCDQYLGPGLPGDPSTAPEFTGGQCEGSYNLSYGTFVITVQNGPQPQFSVNQTILGGIFAENVSGPILSMSRFFDLDQGFGPRRVGVRVLTRNSDLTYTITGPVGGADDFIANAPVSFSVSRNDGPDNCGSPPPLFDSGTRNTTPDPNPGPVGGPPGFPFPGIDITVGPGGDILIDFGDGSEPEPIGPDDTSGGGGGGVPTTPGSPGAPSSPGGGGESSGEAPPGQELTGVLVEVIGAPGSANQFDNISTPTFRGTGYVAMGYPGLLGIDTSGAVVQSPQFFHAQQRGLTAWRVRANVGFSLRTTPYYREATE